MLSHTRPDTIRSVNRDTQLIVSVNYLFGRPLIPYDFPRGIFTSNFRDMGNLRLRIDKNVVWGTEKRSAKIFGKEIRPIRFSGNEQKCPSNFEKTKVTLITEQNR